MSNADLHPTLKKALSSPGDPNATPVEEQTPEAARAEFDSDIAAVDGPAPEVASTKDISIPSGSGDIPARLYHPDSLDDDPSLLIYFHGGGNIRGNIETHDSTCRVLADSGKVLVLSIDYRLAPENPFPAAAEDAIAAITWAVDDSANLGFSPKKLMIGGDSAGGNLAAVACLQLRDNNGPAVAAQMLIYPVIDHVNDYESTRLYSKGFMLDSMPFYTASYLPNEEDRCNPMASPIFAEDFANLPPAFVLSAGFDPLHDEDIAYATKLREAGVRVDHVDYPDMIHGFTLLRGLLPEADKALADAIRRTKVLAGL